MDQIVFVTGSSRSGTTMLGRVLNQHSAVNTFPELHFVEHLCDPDELCKEISDEQALDLMDRLIGVIRDGYLHYRHTGRYRPDAEAILSRSNRPRRPNWVFGTVLREFSQQSGAAISCDQTPRNVLFIDQILEAFPNARIICMVRDPRAVLLSQKRKWKRRYLGAKAIPFSESVRSWFNYHPYTITKLWRASMRSIERYQTHARVLTLRYEDVVSSPTENVTKLCSFLGIPYEPRMLDDPYVGSSSGHDDAHRSKGLTTGSIRTDYKGDLSAAELYVCERMTLPFLARYNYAATPDLGLPLLELLLVAAAFPLKIGMALLFNIRRTRNLRRAIVRRLAG